ncbi:MAG: hypothetical protein WD737_14900 [Gemmatimonadota bacterium]
MNWLIIVAILLIALWAVAEVVGWVLGAALHLLWIGALILFAIWVVQKIRAQV